MNITVIPGEAAIVAIAALVTEIVKGQTPEQKKIIWDRYLEVTKPIHDLFMKILAAHPDAKN